jgi:hypothetical protein
MSDVDSEIESDIEEEAVSAVQCAPVVIDMIVDDDIEIESAPVHEDPDFDCDDLYPPPIDMETNTYRVAKILDYKPIIGEPGSSWFLVKWMGWPVEDATWERQNQLEGAEEVIREFLFMRAREARADRIKVPAHLLVPRIGPT